MSGGADCERAVGIVEEIMTQHWARPACRCWVCTDGRQAGCKARAELHAHRSGSTHGRVFVDPAVHRPKGWAG